GVDVLGQVEQFGDVLAAHGAGEYQRSPRDEIISASDPRGQRVACVGILVFGRVPLADDQYQALAGVFYHSRDLLVELHVELADVHQQKAYIGLFYGGQGTYDAEALDAPLDLAAAPYAGGIEQFDFA